MGQPAGSRRSRSSPGSGRALERAGSGSTGSVARRCSKQLRHGSASADGQAFAATTTVANPGQWHTAGAGGPEGHEREADGPAGCFGARLHRCWLQDAGQRALSAQRSRCLNLGRGAEAGGRHAIASYPRFWARTNGGVIPDARVSKATSGATNAWRAATAGTTVWWTAACGTAACGRAARLATERWTAARVAAE